MEMGTLIFLIIGGVVLFGFVVALVFFIISKLKGGIEINVNNYDVKAGESFAGTIDLNLKNPIEAEALNIGLVAYSKKENISLSSNGARHRTSVIKVCDFKKPVSGKMVYPAGKSSYDFKLAVPSNTLGKIQGTLGQVIRATRMVTGIPYIKWYLVADLNISGMDIKKKLRVNVI